MFDVRLATLDEAPIVRRVMLESFAEYRGVLTPPSGALSETVDDVMAAMRQGGAVLTVTDGAPIGSVRYLLHDGYLYIARVAVLPEYRQRGVGRRMVRFLEHLTLALGLFESQLEVRFSISSNVSFYSSLGYEIIAVQDYPGKTDSWYTMRKRLVD